MRMMAVLITLAVCVAGGAENEGLLEVKGRGIGEGPAYSGGGKVEFTDVGVGGQVIDYDGGTELPLHLSVDYRVLEPAPIVLNSRMGTEYWRLYHFANETMTALYTRENIDLMGGIGPSGSPRAWMTEKYGPLPGKGLVGIRGHYYFLIDPRAGDGPFDETEQAKVNEWLDVTNPPPFFDQPEVGRKLTFTLANLADDNFSFAIDEIQSTWEPGGPFRVKVTVTDADGDTFPVVNCDLNATKGGADWVAEMTTEWTPLNEPTGWMRCNLPEGEVPRAVLIVGSVDIPTGPTSAVAQVIDAAFTRGEGQVSAEEMSLAMEGYELPRNDDGVIRETRALWVALNDLESREATDSVIERAQRARLNVLIPDIFVRSRFAANNDLGLPYMTHEDGGDPLAYFIEKAHAAGLEVHPWYCTAYRDRNFRAWFEEKYGVNVDLIDEDGEVRGEPADLHRPEYRDFIMDLMVGVARDYEVDGIHHDYIRVMKDCYCDKCRAEFEAQFGKPLTESTEAERQTWHRQAVGEIVRRIAEGVREVRPEAKLSAAVFSGMAGGALQGQDPAGWAQQGWVDLVIPMDYAMQTLSVRAHEREFLEALGEEHADQLVTGLSLYQKTGEGSVSRPPELVKEQIEQVRRMGIHGYCLFVTNYLNEEIIAMLRDEVNAEEAVPYFR